MAGVVIPFLAGCVLGRAFVLLNTPDVDERRSPVAWVAALWLSLAVIAWRVFAGSS